MTEPSHPAPESPSVSQRLREWLGVPKAGRWPTRSMDDDLRAGADRIEELERDFALFKELYHKAQKDKREAQDAAADAMAALRAATPNTTKD